MPKKGTKPSGVTKGVARNKTAKKTGRVIKNSYQLRVNAMIKAKRKKTPKERKQLMDQMFDNYFFNLPYTKFIQLTKDWNEENLTIELPVLEDYDEALNYFKKLSPNQLKMLAQTGLDIVGTEAYAALARWHDIISNPARIDKIHKTGLTGKGDSKDTITALAQANDRYGVLKAIRNQLATKLQNNPGNRDTADLSKQLTEVMTQIADYERRLAPDKKTVLGELLSDMPKGGEIKDKRPSKNGSGARQTSFRSRVTIKQLEGK